MKRRTPSSTVPGIVRTVRRRRGAARKGAPPEATVPGRARRAPEAGSGLPRRLGPYRLLEVLGEGGMGTVYLAEETESLRRRVAVKWIRTALVGPHAQARFAAERQALARMNHPSIAQVFEAGTDDEGRPYIVMEHVPGGRITEYRDRVEAGPDVLLGLLAAVGRGLLHAHRQGIVHRDVKPSNVLVKEDPHEGPVPKIIDFGIAKLLDATVQLTRPGDVLGTPAYMSPEQLRGDAVDHRTDVYAFGRLIQELFTGEPEEAFEPPEGCPPGLRRVVETCVAVDPEERYSSFDVLVDELEALRAASEPGEAGEPDDELRELFEAGVSPAAERLLEILESAAARSPEHLRATLEEAGRLRGGHRRAARARRLVVEASAEYHLGSALAGFVLSDDEETAPYFARSVETFRQAREEAPAVLTADDHVELGDALLQLDEPEEAADAYRQALELDTGCVGARYGLALVDLAGSAEDWMGDASRILAARPESAAAHNHFGVVLYESRLHPEISLFGQDKLTAAVAAYEKALRIDPELAPVRFNLGLAFRAQGHVERAREAFGDLEELAEEPLEILPFFDDRRSADPHDEAAGLYRRGCALVRRNEESAREAFRQARQLRRDRR